MEERLSEWFRAKRAIGLPVSMEDLRNQAAVEFEAWWNDLREDQQMDILIKKPERSNFTASIGWFQDYKKR